MKSLFLTLALTLSTQVCHADDLRDLKAYPLNTEEKFALSEVSDLVHELGEVTSESCVNASFKAGTLPVSVQFYRPAVDNDPAFCVDPHYSIMVEFNEDHQITDMKLLDN